MNDETIVFICAHYKRWQHVHVRYVTKLQVSAISSCSMCSDRFRIGDYWL